MHCRHLQSKPLVSHFNNSNILHFKLLGPVHYEMAHWVWSIPIPRWAIPIPKWPIPIRITIPRWAIPNPIPIPPSFDMNNSKSNSNSGIGIDLWTILIPIPELTPSLMKELHPSACSACREEEAKSHGLLCKNPYASGDIPVQSLLRVSDIQV